MKTIKLSRGKTCIVDDSDFVAVSKYKWYCSSMGYAQHTSKFKGKKKEILLHRLIMGAVKGTEIDHINRNPLDNRRSNLRFCTRSENNHNRGINKNNTSGFKGIYWHKGAGKWLAQICLDYKRINIGLFDRLEDAFKERNKYVKTI